MRLLNCMWSTKPAFKSVHLVLSNFINAVAPDDQASFFLIGDTNKQNLLANAESFHSSKKATRKIVSAYFLRKRWLSKITAWQPDLVIIDGISMAHLLLPVLEKYKKSSVLIYVHGQARLRRRDFKLLTKKYPFSLKLVAVSQTLAADIQRQLPQSNVLAIPTYLNLPEFTPQPKVQHDTVVFGAVGRLVDDKNFSILLDCVSQLAKKNLPVFLEIAGYGKNQQLLQDKITQLGLSHNVTLLGYITDTATFYQSIDVLLVPSFQEGLGLVIQEAIHYKKPVICSDILVFKEQLAQAGVYCNAYDAEQWSRACESYMSEKAINDLFELQCAQYEKYNNSKLFRQRCIRACL